MNSAERLLGQTRPLAIDPDGPGPLPTSTLFPGTAGAQPSLAASNEDVVVLASDALLDGFRPRPVGQRRRRLRRRREEQRRRRPPRRQRHRHTRPPARDRARRHLRHEQLLRRHRDQRRQRGRGRRPAQLRRHGRTSRRRARPRSRLTGARAIDATRHEHGDEQVRRRQLDPLAEGQRADGQHRRLDLVRQPDGFDAGRRDHQQGDRDVEPRADHRRQSERGERRRPPTTSTRSTSPGPRTARRSCSIR